MQSDPFDTAIAVFFTHPYYDHIPLLECWLGLHGEVVFYGEQVYGDHDQVRMIRSAFSDRPAMRAYASGHFAYAAFIDLVRHHRPEARRYAFVMDDVFVDDAFWSIPGPVFQFGHPFTRESKPGWAWWGHPAGKFHPPPGYDIYGCGSNADLFAMDREDALRFCDGLERFLERNAFLEIAIPSVAVKEFPHRGMIPARLWKHPRKLSNKEHRAKLVSLLANRDETMEVGTEKN